jgi:hypothetical protein
MVATVAKSAALMVVQLVVRSVYTTVGVTAAR